MGTYRYSEQGIESIARRAGRQSMAVISIAILVGFAAGWSNGAFREPVSQLVSAALLGLALFWTRRRSVLKARGIAASTEFNLDGDTLTARNSLGTTTVSRNALTQIRFMRDGILLRGGNLREIVQVRPELDGFEELAARIQDWAQVGVQRTRTSISTSAWVSATVFANLGLLFLALSVTEPAIAIPCCVLEAILLVSCAIFVWRSKNVAPRLKLTMLIVIVPAISLIGRAYFLLQSR